MREFMNNVDLYSHQKFEYIISMETQRESFEKSQEKY